MQKPKIGISIGDVNGIGPEIIIRCLEDDRLLDHFTPVIYGSSKAISYHKNIVKPQKFNYVLRQSAQEAVEGEISLVNAWSDSSNIQLGEATVDGGRYAYLALDKLVEELKAGFLDAMVTAPIHKNAMKLGEFPYPGHTEYLTERFEKSESVMLMVSDELRIGVVTNHIPVGQIVERITKELVINKGMIILESLKRDFGIDKPKLAILGLNPHAGDGGAIGKEDDEIILPAIQELKKTGAIVMGPFPADGFFGSSKHRKFDAVLACYHDQGLIPFKLLSFGQGINFTAGLPIVRTSVDHGTAYDLVGKNQADLSSLRAALFAATDIARNRMAYDDSYANSLNT